MNRRFTFFLLFFFTVVHKGLAQNISIGTIDAGPYGKGSTIAVPLILSDESGKLLPTNIFKLYLSDANGNFNNEVEIGSYAGFYTTFINGLIPAGAPAGSYKVRVKSSSPTVVSEPSDAFTISSAGGIKASIDASSQTISNNPKTFGSCASGRSNTRFNFTNSSTSGSKVTATFINGFNSADIKQISFEGSSTEQFIAGITHYTIFVKAELNGITGTQAYFLINNTQNTPFSTFGSNTVCLPRGILEYGVEINSPSGIQSNFPGYTYRVNWGDQSIETYTINQIKNNGGKVAHTYFKSSCGSQVVIGSVRYYNVFGIGMQLMSPFCNEIGTPVSTQAKVVTQPENRFGLPAFACINTSLTVNNSSIAGENPSATAPECQNNNVIYYWYVDNKLITPNGVPLSYQLKYTFTTGGLHTVRLESQSSSDCQAAPLEKKIYVQLPPKPAFNLDAETYCLNSTAKTTNTSVTDTTGGAQNSYLWTITGPAAPAFINGTSKSTENAEFRFIKPGVYTVKLTITSACTPVSTPVKTIVVNDIPKITANWNTNLCGKGQLLTFNTSGGNPVTTSFSGTYKDEADSYTWEVSGNGYSFQNGTNANSKYPSILFENYGTYTIKITSRNNCGSASATKSITFNESPTVNAGADTTLCAGSSAQLNGSLSGPPVAGFAWVGGTGTFIPGRNVLRPVYIPSAEEAAAGKVQLSLSAATNIPAPCDKVLDAVEVIINPPNKITSESSDEICTGNELNYEPVAVIEGSLIKWTAKGSANAAGFETNGTGNIKAILYNSDLNSVATVTYTIIPEANGCPGEPFTYTVTVNPLPVVQATANAQTLCTGQPAGITLAPGMSKTLFTWTSSTTGAITGNSSQTTPVSTSAINDILVNSSNTSGTVTYIITPVNSTGCPGESVTVTLNITPPPVKADAGPDQTLCNEHTVKLSANHPGSGTGKWALASGQTGISLDDDTKIDAIASGLAAGQVYRFKWTITGPGTCNSSEDEVVINNLSELKNNTITYSGYTVCEGSSITVTGSSPLGGDATYTYSWEASQDGNNWNPINLKTQKDLNVIINESTFFRRKVSSGTCSTISGIVKVDAQKGISNNTITGQQHICLDVIPVRLEGSAPAGADGTYQYQWQQSADNKNWSVILAATQQFYQPAALKQTTYFRRVVTSTICTGAQQSISNSIEIRVSKGAVANFNWNSESACAPFQITAQNINAEKSEDGDTYEWFANGKSIGKSIDFPGYTLNKAGESVEIRLDVTSALGCGTRSFSHSFKTNSTITADFTADNASGCGPFIVNFTNTTQNTEGVNFEWNFGNGQKSFKQMPAAVSFDARADGKDTTYNVTLRATSSCATSEKTVQIKVIGKPMPRFSPSTVEGCSPLTVTFRNLSPGSSNTYIWNFGDGSKTETYTDSRSVSHVFKTGKPASFIITMTVRNACGEKTSSHTIKVAPNTVNPDLVVNADQLAGCAPHTVKFYNYSTGATHYAFVFEDGTDTLKTISDEPIEHTFTKEGVYNVKLIASNCSDTIAVKTITVYPGANAQISADKTEGCAPLTVKFSNKTTHALSQLWDFGDGTSFHGANPPPHTYTAKQSSYTVKLITRSNYGCTDTLEMADYIKVTNPPTADFEVLPGEVIQYPNYRFSFKNYSRGDAVKISWDFGDRSPYSAEQNPEHDYPDTGVYQVKLSVSNSMGCSDIIEKTVRITGTPGNLFIPNAFMPNSNSEELRSFRAKGSGIEKWHFRIFNKWGELLWQTDKLDEKGAPSEAWDGTFNGVLVPQGVYFWEVSAVFKNGTEWAGMSYNNQEPKKTGAIHLIR